MSTPRKNWFKVPDSIAFDNLTNDELAGMIRLQGYMNARWARDGRREEERGRAALDSRLIMMITGKRRADVAAKLLERLANICEMFVERHADIIEIFWPNYAIFQEPDSRKSPSPISETPPSQEQERKRESRAPSEPPASRAPRSRSSGKADRKTRVPDKLDDEHLERVLRWAAGQKPPISPHAVAYGWKVFTAKARANGYRYVDHAQAFENALGAAGDPWALSGYQPPAGSPSSRYRDADDVIAEAKRRQAEDDERRRNESTEAIGQLIDLSLRQAGGSAA